MLDLPRSLEDNWVEVMALMSAYLAMEGELRAEGVNPAVPFDVIRLLMNRFTRVTHAADLWRERCKELVAQKPPAREPK